MIAFRQKYTNAFKKDLKKLKKQNKNKLLLEIIMNKIINKQKLDKSYKDHELKNNLRGSRDCHIEPDWILQYKIDKKNNTVIFERTGSHSELFK